MLSLVEANGIDGQPGFRGNLADLQSEFIALPYVLKDTLWC